jgi:hypothetical protein
MVATMAEAEEAVTTTAETETPEVIREGRRIFLPFFVSRIARRDHFESDLIISSKAYYLEILLVYSNFTY